MDVAFGIVRESPIRNARLYNASVSRIRPQSRKRSYSRLPSKHQNAAPNASQNIVSILTISSDTMLMSFETHHFPSMLIGYARVSTDDQDSALQRDALTKAGCEKIFDEIMSGARADRPQLRAVLDFARKGDVLVVWKLDRLARSLTQLITTVEQMEKRGVGFKSLTETIGATSAGGRLIFRIFGALAAF